MKSRQIFDGVGIPIDCCNGTTSTRMPGADTLCRWQDLRLLSVIHVHPVFL
ncbi:MAG: hypothetical protein ACYTEX_06710 [Planctomycetota bacterium]